LEKQVQLLQGLLEEQWKDTQKPKLLGDDELERARRDLNFKWNKKKINDKADGFDVEKTVETVLQMEDSFQQHAELTEKKKMNLLDLQRML